MKKAMEICFQFCALLDRSIIIKWTNNRVFFMHSLNILSNFFIIFHSKIFYVIKLFLFLLLNIFPHFLCNVIIVTAMTNRILFVDFYLIKIQFYQGSFNFSI